MLAVVRFDQLLTFIEFDSFRNRVVDLLCPIIRSILTLDRSHSLSIIEVGAIHELPLPQLSRGTDKIYDNIRNLEQGEIASIL